MGSDSNLDANQQQIPDNTPPSQSSTPPRHAELHKASDGEIAAQEAQHAHDIQPNQDSMAYVGKAHEGSLQNPADEVGANAATHASANPADKFANSNSGQGRGAVGRGGYQGGGGSSPASYSSPVSYTVSSGGGGGGTSGSVVSGGGGDSGGESPNDEGDKSSGNPDDKGNGENTNKEDKNKPKKPPKEEMAKKAAKHAAAGTAAEAGKNVAVTTLLAGGLSSFMHATVAGAASLFSTIGSAIYAGISWVGGAISGFFSGIVSGVSSVLSISATAATIATTVATVSLVPAVAMTIGTVVTAFTLTMNGEIPADFDDCGVAVDRAASAAAGSTETSASEIEAQRQEVVRKLWLAFKEIRGWDDIHIAGMLGNYQRECGFDPAGIEGIEEEAFNPTGPKHQMAMADLHSYTENYLFYDCYGGTAGLEVSYYRAAGPGKSRPGMGLMQWTGPAAERLLQLANECGTDWYSPEFQIALMFAKAPELETNDLSAWDKYAATNFASPSDAAYYFVEHIEGNPPTADYCRVDLRMQFAEEWYQKIPSFQKTTADSTFIESIRSFSQRMGTIATANAVAAAKETCASRNCTTVTSLAEAAVALSWPNQSMADNEGTELYQEVRKELFGADGPAHNRDCGAFVATAVIWSGTDLEYPIIWCEAQRNYVQTSPKWQTITSDFNADTDYDKLQPGDVFITNAGSSDDHTILFTGNELIVEKFGDQSPEGADFCHASLDKFPARVTICGIREGYFHGNTDGLGRHYSVYRCVKPDGNPKQLKAGSVSGSTTMCTEDDGSMGPTTEEGKKIVEACKTTPSPGGGLCAGWVCDVYENAGFPIERVPGACDMYEKWCHSTNKADLSPGMIVAVSTHPHTSAGSKWGHVAIYIGKVDGVDMVMDNIGQIRTTSLDEWINYYDDSVPVRWGWPSGINPT